ncbi:MAG: methyltransferase domain-containing protein [Rhizobiales bacterium]|nr:methyltransferase domain-containing protein [Hyphomicrobiales bacterium]
MSAPPTVFDRRLLAARRARAGAAVPDFLLRHVAGDIVERLGAVQRTFAVAADIGTPLPLLAEAVAASGRAGRTVRLAPPGTPPGRGIETVVGDEELLPFAPASLDLAVSALALQFVNDLPGVLAQLRRALRPDGLLLAAFVGGESLRELAEVLALAESEVTGGASPRVAPFVEVRAAGGLLQRAGFALPVVDQDRVTVRYADAIALMRDLRAMGATNMLVERDRRPLRRAVLAAAAADYASRFADPDGRIRVTFDIVSVSGWVPHESQQKPLAPGSARVRLADALGAKEEKAGEKAGGPSKP